MRQNICSLTIYTPTYNRAYILPQAYESLVRQTDNNFLWLIVDDGSTDDTEKLVHEWILSNKLHIKYIKKENGGMLTARNTAFDVAESELLFCLDSDDNLYPRAVETIKNVWETHRCNIYAGIIADEHYRISQKVIGRKLPDIASATFCDLKYIYKMRGDKVVILTKEVYKNYSVSTPTWSTFF